MADHWPKSSSAAAPQDGCACRDILEPANNPCSACSVPVRGSRSPSAGARCPEPRFGGCRSQDSEPQDRGIRRSGRRQAPVTVAPGLCIQAYVGSKPRTPAGQLPCALPWRVRQKPGWKRHKCFRATWCRLGAHRARMPAGAGIGKPLPIAVDNRVGARRRVSDKMEAYCLTG
jgi:hypothetical protein